MQYGKHTAMACGALLSTVLLLLPLGIGQTQARYENTVSWKGVYHAAVPQLRSNFLAEGGRTVLLKDWAVSTTSFRTVGIQLATDGLASRGALRCEVDSNLITAQVDDDSYDVGKTKNHATLTLTATQQAQNLTEQTEVTVRVSWIDEGREGQQPTAWADFVVKLLPQIQDTAPSESGGVRPEGGSLGITCPKTFAPKERLAIKLTLPEGTDNVVLSYDGGNFPENTGYRVNAGEGFVLAEDMAITIPTAGLQELQVVLDFSWTTLHQDSFFLSAAACAGNYEITAENVTVSTTRQALEVETDSAAIVMGADAQVTLPIYGDLDGCVWTLQQLVQVSGETVYTASNALTIQTETANNNDGTTESELVITNIGTRAPAGKYRLTLQRVQNGAVLSSVEVTVFVCY